MVLLKLTIASLAALAYLSICRADHRNPGEQPTFSVAELIEEAKEGTSIHGSEAIETVRVSSKDVPRLLDLVHRYPDDRSYLLLIALQRQHPCVYAQIPNRIKASILCSAFWSHGCMDDWGSPEHEDWHTNSEAEQMLREVGVPGITFLLPILDEREGAAFEESGETDYSRGDFACRLASLLFGLSSQFQNSIDARDRMNDLLKKEIAMAPDGRMAALHLSGQLLDLWKPQPPDRRRGASRRVVAEVVTPAGKRLATAIALWQLAPDDKLVDQPLSDAALKQAWRDLGDVDSQRAWRAAWRLTRSPSQAVPFLAARLPKRLELADPKVALFIESLNSREYAVRREAMNRLESLGRAARPALARALGNSPPLEMRRRLEALLSKLESEPVTQETVRWLRAAIVLEHAADADARDLLRRLTGLMPSIVIR